jgi:hypothetical protein
MSQLTDEEPNLVRLVVDGPMAVITNNRPQGTRVRREEAAWAEGRPPVYRKR